MGRAGVKVGGTGWIGRRRPPLVASGRHADEALVAALPALAILRSLENGQQNTELPGNGQLPEPTRGDQRRLLAALDRALEAIVAPALVLTRTGEVLHANSIARATLGANADGVPSPRSPARAELIRSPERSENSSAWELTPLGRPGETFGYLAILHPPAPGQALGAALTVAIRSWKLTRRQTEILELVTRGLTNELIAESLGIRKVTVEFHLSAIFDKAGVYNRATLIARALEIARR